jgi:hypothetical protein
MFTAWSSDLRHRRDDVSEEDLAAFGHNMFGGDFVFNVDRDFVRECPAPLLVLSGNDEFHPQAVAQEIADLAPHAQLVLDWAGPERHESTAALVRNFLVSHTPEAS